jgi:DNA-binding transcriptional MerR regulator
MPTSVRVHVDMKSSPGITIGELAERFGLAAHVLRHWESVGLLAPARVTAGRRRYRPDDLYRVAVILRAKQAGFSLPDIRVMMTTSDAARRKAILRRQRDAVVERIAQAQAALGLIEGALACDHDDVAACPRFQALLAADISATARQGAVTRPPDEDRGMKRATESG